MIYTVGEIAKQMGVSASTLRYYDKEGLLPFVERSKGGIRMFKDEDLPWLNIIECLKKTGMSIKDIKVFIDYSMEGDSKIDERLDIISSQRNIVENKIKEFQNMLDMLNYKTWFYETSKKAGTCAIHKDDTDNLDNIPKKFHKFIVKK
ncbi:MerR family transcriptional regulator [Oceanotoga teriensis]|uniref:MerR family transcriptional regulator n=1 Tax=Oceanotoga teriensis TaxID=515440 RepID=UPI0027128DCC|nr:MerR family transcriptional regulator [Oceanotoga teriensis]MDO7977768.1 MerR family transcriptional regulator [Oceanotoga teriensis]